MGGTMKEKQVLLGEREESIKKAMGAQPGKSRWGVIHLVPLEVVEERGKDGQECLVEAMQTPLPDIPMTPGSVPPATPLPEIPSTPEPGVPATPYGKE
jgi:hypothetical protein